MSEEQAAYLTGRDARARAANAREIESMLRVERRTLRRWTSTAIACATPAERRRAIARLRRRVAALEAAVKAMGGAA